MGRGCIFRRVSAKVIERLTFEQRLEGDETAASRVDSVGKSVPNGKGKCKGPDGGLAWCAGSSLRKLVTGLK